MRRALYCPVYGYYEGEKDKIGQRGDFFTSVSAGSLFGELLAFQFSKWLEELAQKHTSRNAPLFRIIEAGAYDGQLACDILGWIQARRPLLWDKLVYVMVEPLARLRQRQQERLAGFGDHVQWVLKIEDVNRPSPQGLNQNLSGIIFSNELLDAMPVRRIGWDVKTQQWFEWGVTLQGDEFVWHKIHQPPIPIQLANIPRAILDVLPNEFTTEICPAAIEWWRKAAGVLGQGRLIAIDYGLTEDEFILPQRREGTLRSYAKHQLTNDLLVNPGEQDLTVQVNFTAIQSAGEMAGLKTELLVSQEKFLIEIAGSMLKGSNGVSAWTSAQRRQFQTLTHPQHLGRPFRVLVQSRSAAVALNS